jgi:hypothetical protein
MQTELSVCYCEHSAVPLVSATDGSTEQRLLNCMLLAVMQASMVQQVKTSAQHTAGSTYAMWFWSHLSHTLEHCAACTRSTEFQTSVEAILLARQQ